MIRSLSHTISLVLPRLVELEGLDQLGPLLVMTKPATEMKWRVGDTEYAVKASAEAVAVIYMTYGLLTAVVDKLIKRLPAVAQLLEGQAAVAAGNGSTSAAALAGGSRKRNSGSAFVLPNSEKGDRMQAVGALPCTALHSHAQPRTATHHLPPPLPFPLPTLTLVPTFVGGSQGGEGAKATQEVDRAKRCNTQDGEGSAADDP